MNHVTIDSKLSNSTQIQFTIEDIKKAPTKVEALILLIKINYCAGAAASSLFTFPLIVR